VAASTVATSSDKYELNLADEGINEVRAHQGRWCFSKTPMHIFLDGMPMTKEKMIVD